MSGLAPNLDVVHLTLGRIEMYCEWNFDGAMENFERAVEANQNCLEANYHLTQSLIYLKRTREP